MVWTEAALKAKRKDQLIELILKTQNTKTTKGFKGNKDYMVGMFGWVSEELVHISAPSPEVAAEEAAYELGISRGTLGYDDDLIVYQMTEIGTYEHEAKWRKVEG